MTTTSAPDRDTPAPPASTRSRVPLLALVVVIVLVPLIVTLVSLIGRHWHPSSDDALEVLRIRDVAGRHTPLTGAQSRYGFDHPGPLLFWLLAPFRWVGGDTGVLIGVVTLNAAAVAGALFLAARRGGPALLAIVAVASLVLMRALGMTLLSDPWNPWIAVMPFLAYMLCAWSVAERDLALLPWLVGIGSFLVQTHVGYAPLVLGAGATAALLAISAHGKVDKGPFVISAIVLAVLWAAPVVQQITGHPGNLSEIVDYFRHPTEKTLGIAVGFGLMGRELRVPGPWITGNDTSVLGFVFTASTLPAIALLGTTALSGVLASSRNARSAARLSALVIATSIVGVIAGGRITGAPGPYLLRWWWVIAALVWCSLAWSIVKVFPRVRVVLMPVAAAAVVVLVIAAAWDATPVELPQQNFSDALARLVPATAAHLHRERSYFFTWVDTRDLGGPVGVGTYLALSERGYTLKVDRAFSHPFGSWRVARGPTDGTITVIGDDDLAQGTALPPGSVEVARYDALTADERQRATNLANEIRASLAPGVAWHENAVDSAWGRGGLIAGGADAADVAALARLRRRGIGYVVFVSPS